MTPLFEGNLLTQRHEIWSQQARALRWHNRYRVVNIKQTDREKDRQTDGQNYDNSMRLILRAVARKNDGTQNYRQHSMRR